MLTQNDLKPWIIEALKANNGEANVVQIAKHIWENHESELRKGGDMFFKWQYEFRWAGQKLQDEKRISKGGPKGTWLLRKDLK